MANLGLETAGDEVTIGAMQGLELPYAHCLMYRGYAQAWLGDIDGGLIDLSRAVELTAARGAREDHAYALFWRTNAFSTLGDGRAALADAEEALRFAEEAGSSVALSVARAGLAQACALTGDLDRAENMAAKASSSSEPAACRCKSCRCSRPGWPNRCCAAARPPKPPNSRASRQTRCAIAGFS